MPKSEAAKVARLFDLADRPVEALLEELEDGTLTVQTVEAVKNLNPATYEAIRDHVVQRLPELRKELAYSKKLVLGRLLELEVDSTQRGEFLAGIQRSYAAQATVSETPARPSEKTTETPTTGQKLAGVDIA